MSETSSVGAWPQSELQGAIYCWVSGKAPKTSSWNQRQNLLTLEQIRTGHKRESWATGYGMVSGRYSGFLCVDVDTKPERPELPDVTFRQVTGGKSIADLPPSATVISGKPGRKRIYLRVPSLWWPKLSGYSFDRGDLELRWEDGGPEAPAAKQSVIDGPHPEGGYYFRWAEGLRPEDVGIADAPTWLLIGMVADCFANIGAEEALVEGTARTDTSGPTPCERLHPKMQRRLVREMSAFWPYRGGEPGTRYQCSYKQDGFNSLLAALFNLFGPDMAEDWLADTEWFKNSEDWGGGKDFHRALVSLGKSKARDHREAGWGTLAYLARRVEQDGVEFQEPPFQWPRWAQPPVEIDLRDMAKEVTQTLTQLRDSLHFIDELEDPASREVAYQRLQKKLGCTEREMKTLLRHLDQENDPATGGAWNDVVKNAKPIIPAIERLLPANCVTMVASDGGVGKSVLIYRIAEAAAYGKKVFGQLQAQQGNVLIVQTDESDSNLQQKSQLMGFDDPGRHIRVEFAFNAGMFPDLRAWVRAHQAKYVLMDSFGSLFAGGAELSDAEAGMYLYKLNKIASEEGCAILMTHHLRKQDKSRTGIRERVTMGDLYGSAYIVNGCSDVWGITVGENDEFTLTILKDRSGVSQRGDTFQLQGDREDLSFGLRKMNADERGVENLKSTERLLLKQLSSRTEENPLTQTELCAATGKSPATVKRVMRELMTAGVGVQRRRRPVENAGSRPWEYWQG